MGDVCQPFYYDALGLERVASKRRALRVFFSLTIHGQMEIMCTELHFFAPIWTSFATKQHYWLFFFKTWKALKPFLKKIVDSLLNHLMFFLNLLNCKGLPSFHKNVCVCHAFHQSFGKYCPNKCPILSFYSFYSPQNASKLLRSDCLYREKRCFFPWASLFIWAVLQNRSEMASFFWEMVKTSTASYLSGRELSADRFRESDLLRMRK